MNLGYRNAELEEMNEMYRAQNAALLATSAALRADNDLLHSANVKARAEIAALRAATVVDRLQTVSSGGGGGSVSIAASPFSNAYPMMPGQGLTCGNQSRHYEDVLEAVALGTISAQAAHSRAHAPARHMPSASQSEQSNSSQSHAPHSQDQGSQSQVQQPHASQPHATHSHALHSPASNPHAEQSEIALPHAPQSRAIASTNATLPQMAQAAQLRASQFHASQPGRDDFFELFDFLHKGENGSQPLAPFR